ncbi:GTPase IMAP family member 8-like [Thalassophryne amazonica]|uniref:GTPase IMAP family member 8-like n=1 Tax=Thalassophryne amazonica TaxID=390379 RepID=UPI00147215B5|nr:GTPase IMAP family member 8-like [Thalassophryne amazonica]
MAQRKSQYFSKNLIIVLLGKNAHFKNFIGNIILDNEAFCTVSNDCSMEMNKAFKIINTPDIFDEECPHPDQQIIDCMALSHPGPNLFILVMGSENTQENEVAEDINKLKRIFGDTITTKLVVIFEDMQSLQRAEHLQEEVNMTVPDDNLIRKCSQWCSTSRPYNYTYNKYSEEVVTSRKHFLSKSRCESPPYNNCTAVALCQYPSIQQQNVTKPAETVANAPKNSNDEVVPQPSTVGSNHTTYRAFTITLLGQSGTGKSASANTILMAAKSPPTAFTSVPSSMPVTKECEIRVMKKLFGSQVRVIDTPDFFHDKLNVPQQEIERLKAYCCQSACVYLVVLQLGRYTEDERYMVQRLEQKLGWMIRDKAIVLLTHGEDLKGQSVEEYINQQSNLCQMVRLCGNRCHVFNNKAKDKKQVMELVKKIPYYPDIFPKIKDKDFSQECCIC